MREIPPFELYGHRCSPGRLLDILNSRSRFAMCIIFGTIVKEIPSSALHHVDCEAAERGFLVAFVHVEAGLAHRLDDLVEADEVVAGADQSEARSLDRLDRADRVALDAGDLDQARDRIAGEAEIMLHSDLGGILDLPGRSTERRGEPGGGHRAGDSDLALAADLGSGDGGILLEQRADRGGGEKEDAHPLLVRMGDETLIVAQDGG